TRLDPAAGERAQAILDAPAGAALKPAATQPAERSLSAADAGYIKSTPSTAAAAMDGARKRAEQVGAQMKLKLRELETAHFIIFTDWSAGDDAFLRDNLEAAYAAVARQFKMSPKDNIFVGKLPVYMFGQKD